MFDFEKLEVYSKAKEFHFSTQKFIAQSNIDSSTGNQLKMASLKIILNIAEGSGRKTNADKKNFFITARGSVFECAAIFDILKDEELLSREIYSSYYNTSVELSTMLNGMILKLERLN